MNVEGAERRVSRVAVSGTAVTLTLDPEVGVGQAVGLTYRLPGANPIQDTVGNAARAITNRTVENNTRDTTAPSVSRVAITSDPGLDGIYAEEDVIEITVTFSETVPRPIVVRVDEVGRAEALAYETVEAQADPRDPTTKYFLNRFLHDHFGRRRAMAQEYWPRSLRFLTTDLANAAFTASNEEIAMLAAGITGEELRVENVVLRIQPNPTEPHGAVADFVLVRTRQEREVSREAWTATMQFVFMPVIPADLVVFNPMGIQVTYLETDRTLITETP